MTNQEQTKSGISSNCLAALSKYEISESICA